MGSVFPRAIRLPYDRAFTGCVHCKNVHCMKGGDTVSAVEPPGEALRPEHRPVATWVLMFLAAAVTLLFPDWTGSGSARPLWIFAFPIVLGLAGAGLAARSSHFWWALLSACWGFFLIQGLVVAATLIGGP